MKVKRYFPIYYARQSPCYTTDHLGNGGCPARNDIPRFLFAMWEGDFETAFHVLKLTNPFSGGCGRFCDHPCEKACNREKFDTPVDIMALERVAADYGFEKGIFPEEFPHTTGKRVAVIGGGAAGLTAAFFLKRLGHAVTVYERERKAGGLMRFGIPRYRYPEEIAAYEIEYIERAGVKIETSTDVGSGDLKELVKEYDAVIVATGALKEKKIGCPGDSLPGVWSGVSYLRDINLSKEMDDGKISALAKRISTGERVAVIGGGYTSFDVARSAVRLGSKVSVFYRRTPEQMTAHPGEIQEAEKEGITFTFLAIPVELKNGKDGSTEMTFQRARLGAPDESGRARPVPLEGDFFTIEVDRVITAIGEDSGLHDLIEEPGKRNSKIFLTGDVRVENAGDTGMVVRAIGSGQDTALDVHRALTGIDIEITSGDEIAYYETIKTRYFEEKERAHIRRIPIDERKMNFRETTLPLEHELAVEMAGRCFFCGICIQCDWCYDYGRGAIARMMVPWSADRDAHFYKFVRERVTDKTKEAVWACPRNTMAVVPEEDEWEPIIIDQYI
jgi:NADPH-dependent glutamate synthase beta subunit-like oxidoreductase